VVIDVVHPGQDRASGEHRRREQRPGLQRAGCAGDPCQLRAQRPQPRQHRKAGQRPGLGGSQVPELLRRRGPQREAHAHRCQQRHVTRLPGDGAGDRPGGRPRQERVQQHRPRIPGPGARRPRLPGLRLRGRRLRRFRRLRFRRLRSRGRRGLRAGRLFLFRGERQRPGHVRAAQPAQHRGLVHPQPPRDFRVPHPGCPPGERLLPRRPGGLLRAARLADQARRAFLQGPLVQRRHVVRRHLHQRGDCRAGEPQLPQHRDRDVPHPGVVLGEAEQLHRPGEDRRLAAAVQPVQVTRVRHAIQDGGSGGGHTSTPSLFNVLCKEIRPVTAGQRRTHRRSGPATKATASAVNNPPHCSARSAYARSRLRTVEPFASHSCRVRSPFGHRRSASQRGSPKVACGNQSLGCLAEFTSSLGG
jgi:hypothetical protein